MIYNSNQKTHLLVKHGPYFNNSDIDYDTNMTLDINHE